MIKFNIKKDYINHFFKSIKAVDNECILEIYNNKWKSTSINMPATVMISIELDKDAFLLYEIDQDMPSDYSIKYGIDINKVIDILKSCGEDVELIFDDSEMKIKSDGIEFNTITISTENIRSENPPTLEFKSSVGIVVDDIKRSLNAVKKIDDSVAIEIHEDGISFSQHNKLKNEYVVSKYSHTQLIHVKCDEKSISNCKCEYLHDILNTLKKNDMIVLYASNNMPIKIEYESTFLNYEYYIAPIIADE